MLITHTNGFHYDIFMRAYILIIYVLSSLPILVPISLPLIPFLFSISPLSYHIYLLVDWLIYQFILST